MLTENLAQLRAVARPHATHRVAGIYTYEFAAVQTTEASQITLREENELALQAEKAWLFWP